MNRAFVAIAVILSFAAGVMVGRGTAPMRASENSPVFEGLVKVSRVIDGDTIEIEGGEKVRYLGVNTPESTTKKECFGHEAAVRNRELVEGKVVRLERGKLDREKYGRLIRYVYVDGKLVNLELIREGYAFAYMVKGMNRADEFENAEREARDARRGMWKSCDYARTGDPKHPK